MAHAVTALGRRLPLMVGLVIYIAASIGCAFAGSIPELIIWRLLQALGGCAGMVVTLAIIRDRCSANDAARAAGRDCLRI